MRAKYKLFLLVMVPLFLVVGYLVFNVTHTFGQIKETRNVVFVQSALEVKYATSVQYLSALMTTLVDDIHFYREQGDLDAYSKSVLRYRELQQQRYYSMQKLSETAHLNESAFVELYGSIDLNKESLLAQINQEVLLSNEQNERILTAIASHPAGESSEHLDVEKLATDAANVNDTLTEEIGQFVEARYLKVEKVSKALEGIEQNALNTLYVNAFMGILLGFFVVLFIEIIIIQPIEHLARAFETRDISRIDKLNSNLQRQDEIGFLMREVHDTLLGLNEERLRETQRKKRSARKSSSSK